MKKLSNRSPLNARGIKALFFINRNTNLGWGGWFRRDRDRNPNAVYAPNLTETNAAILLPVTISVLNLTSF